MSSHKSPVINEPSRITCIIDLKLKCNKVLNYRIINSFFKIQTIKIGNESLEKFFFYTNVMD